MAEIMAEEFVPPTDEPAGEAWYEAQALTQDFWLIDHDSSDFKQRDWEIWDLWLALQSHYDNDNSQYNQRCIENGREQSSTQTLKSLKTSRSSRLDSSCDVANFHSSSDNV